MLIQSISRCRFGNQKHTFPLCRGQSVVCADGPSVGFINEDFVSSHIDHRFDGECHSRNDKHTCTALAEVLNVRFFMELDSYAVPAQVAYYTVSVFSACS